MNGEVINEKSTEYSGGVNYPNNSKRSKNMIVSLLDDTEYRFDVEPRSKGEELLKKVNTHLNLEESEFFGLLFDGKDQIQYWLDPQKSIIKQIRDPLNMKFKFRVMYYTPDPNSLQEYTRYLFTLQIRRDLLDGKLVCPQETGALLASYIVQGELGDFDMEKHGDGYLKGFNFVPDQTPEIEDKIVNYHKSHYGKNPAASDQQMLDIARNLDMYGITLYPGEDNDGHEIRLTMNHMGITVFRHKQRVHDYLWEDLRKLSFKKKKVLLKLRSQVGTSNVISYNMKNRNAAKNFWKICVNHHVFFRALTAVKPIDKRSSFRKGSKYRYTGRTKKEITEGSLKDRVRRPVEDDSSFSPTSNEYSDHQILATTPSNASNATQYRSDDEATYSIRSESSYQKEDSRVDRVATEEYNAPSNDSSDRHNMSGVEHQEIGISDDVLSSGNYQAVQSDSLFSDKSFPKLLLLDKLKLTDSNENSIDATINVPSTDSTADDDNDFSQLDTFKTHDFSLEVESMFKKINSEYGGSERAWLSVSSNECDDENKEERSETEDNIPDSSEFTEVDANQVMVSLSENSPTIDFDDRDAGFHMTSDKTEADEETEMQLKQKVIELYQPRQNITPSYDSDSDASAMTQDEESSAFEDDESLPASSSSSVSSLHHREGYLNQIRKLKSSGDVYNVAKEMLLTERTLVKDLEVITVSFRNAIEKDKVISEQLVKLLFDNFDPLYDYHCSLLMEVEERLTSWEMASPAESSQDNVLKIGDILHRNMRQMKHNVQYIKKHEEIQLALESETKRSKKFAKVYKEFELGSVCYLSLSSFLLKPIQRMLYYRNMLERLTADYGNQHSDAIDAKVAFEEVSEACHEVQACRENLVNLHKLIELQRDLVGLEELVHPKRRFIRGGCLHKICRKGPQPRMFFLLSDVLLYTSQGVTASNQFRARASVPLRDIKLENGGVELHGLYAFTVVGPGEKSFIAAANSPEEKARWMSDIQTAIDNAVRESFCNFCEANKTEFILNVGSNNRTMCPSCKDEIGRLENMSPEDRLSYWRKNYPTPITINTSTSEADSDDEGSYAIGEQYTTLDRRYGNSRNISTRKVCWHRNSSISMKEYALSMENSLSGILRRKYKNTTRWQRLWVVFTNFSLYFFKNYEEDAPFASLPLIGYVVSKPAEAEVPGEFAIKLQFKTHVYIFRADREYNYKRWMEVLTLATRNSSKQARFTTRMGSRLASSS